MALVAVVSEVIKKKSFLEAGQTFLAFDVWHVPLFTGKNIVSKILFLRNSNFDYLQPGAHNSLKQGKVHSFITH